MALRTQAGDPDASGRAQASANRTLRLAQHVAEDTLADAGRLAEALLVEAERQAEGLVAKARRSASWMTEEARTSLEEEFGSRHEEVLALLTECRQELRALRESSRGPESEPDPPSADHIGPGKLPGEPPLPTSIWVGRSPTQVRNDNRHSPQPRRVDPTTKPAAAPPTKSVSLPDFECSDEQFLVALYQAIAGTERTEAPSFDAGDIVPAASGDSRARAIRASHREAADRAAAERLAMQTEALRRRSPRGTTSPVDGADVVVALSGQRGSRPGPPARVLPAIR